MTIGTRYITLSLLWPKHVRRLCHPKELNKEELGTCPTTIPPTTVSSALSKATAFRSWGFPAACRTYTISPVLGVHIPLKIWWPRITLSWRKIESSDTRALAIFSVLVICSTFTIGAGMIDHSLSQRKSSSTPMIQHFTVLATVPGICQWGWVQISQDRVAS